MNIHRKPLLSTQGILMGLRVSGAARIWLTGLAATSVLACGATAQSSSQQKGVLNPVGMWRGASVCVVRPSACHDEIVVYRIAHTKAVDSLTLDGRRIVAGEEQEMGVLTCRFKSPNGPLTCAIPRGIWRFYLRKDSLVGELRLSDNTKFRDVRTVRAR